MKRYMIVVAGGKGVRMGADLPKQFLPLNGKPLVMLTLENLHRMDVKMYLILVLPEDQMGHWQELCREHCFTIPIQVVSGGTTRFHSVQNGLFAIKDVDEALVGVHDGVRPFVSRQVLDDCFTEAVTRGAVIPLIEIHDTLRHITGGSGASETVPRDRYRLVQTPQVFQLPLLRRAYEQRYMECFTDDASVVEYMGESVFPVEGNRENIKLTTPFDWMMAQAIMEFWTQQQEI